MATVQWSAFTDRGNLASTILDSLANATISAASTALDNATNKDTHAIIEINLGSAAFITTGDCYLELYMVKAPDGSNYEDAPAAGGADRNTLIATIPIIPTTSAKRVMTGLITLPPCPVKFYVTNQANVTLAASGNTIDVYTANLTST